MFSSVAMYLVFLKKSVSCENEKIGIRDNSPQVSHPLCPIQGTELERDGTGIQKMLANLRRLRWVCWAATLPSSLLLP